MKQLHKDDNEPLYKEEFSISSAHEALVNRRQFTKFLTLTSLGMFTGNLWILGKGYFEKKPSFPRQVVGKEEDVPLGAVKLFRYPEESDPCILVHTQDDAFVAYSQKCTHLSCPIIYSNETKQLECPCHEGSFSLETGAVIKGPPPRALPKIVLERQNGVLVAVGIEASHE
ncbi:MAG: Rieske (2Fe-2S) protein [Candidatus Melainabacteria bacterium]|jgi:Rieske Fe-S protein|nr:Rieske (2Fe-2S) protein [Candidatus Melainabacteria bacterium]